MRRDAWRIAVGIALIWLWPGSVLAAPASSSAASNWFGNIGVTVTLLLGVIGFFRTIEQNKDGAFRDVATQLCDKTSPVVRAAAAGQLPDYFRYRRYYFGRRPYASQVLHLILHSLKKEDDLDVRQVLFNSLVAITANATLKTVAQAAGTDLGRGIDLIRAKLDEVIMNGFDFTGIDLTDASLYKSSAIGAKFVGANLWKVRVVHSNLQEADFTDAELWDASFEHVDLRRANLLTTQVNASTSIRQCDLRETTRSQAVQDRVSAG